MLSITTGVGLKVPISANNQSNNNTKSLSNEFQIPNQLAKYGNDPLIYSHIYIKNYEFD